MKLPNSLKFPIIAVLILLTAVLLLLGDPLMARPVTGKSTLVINSSNGISRSYFLNGRSVSIEGSGNRIKLVGYCPYVRIRGTGNVVAVDAARAISISGRGNKVTWRRTANGVSPRTHRSGSDNSVSRTTK